MQPALNPDTLEKSCPDIVFLNRWAVKDFVIQRGDVVSMISPREPDEIIIKRVIAVEGDTIRTLKYKNRYVKVPTGHIWIEGDHSEVSLDSNIFGPVSLGLLHAKASRIVWPPHRQQKLKSFVPSNRQPVNSKTQNFEHFILDDDEELALSTL
ncbi:mitochondrial inner membrane protease subunit 2-like [Anneissia japonica]|uniref:mitochondrial inner membrane protease subunit 2-like n=1 Tax=Anneissia japonica TaxID=1529436 RepID=UPI0014259BB7|nr:mitochondrial inner membrane protease subunit 2-like [Anneissia japonica]